MNGSSPGLNSAESSESAEFCCETCGETVHDVSSDIIVQQWLDPPTPSVSSSSPFPYDDDVEDEEEDATYDDSESNSNIEDTRYNNEYYSETHGLVKSSNCQHRKTRRRRDDTFIPNLNSNGNFYHKPRIRKEDGSTCMTNNVDNSIANSRNCSVDNSGNYHNSGKKYTTSCMMPRNFSLLTSPAFTKRNSNNMLKNFKLTVLPILAALFYVLTLGSQQLFTSTNLRDFTSTNSNVNTFFVSAEKLSLSHQEALAQAEALVASSAKKKNPIRAAAAEDNDWYKRNLNKGVPSEPVPAASQSAPERILKATDPEKLSVEPFKVVEASQGPQVGGANFPNLNDDSKPMSQLQEESRRSLQGKQQYRNQDICLTNNQAVLKCGRKWGITNNADVTDYWMVNEVRFYWDKHCSVQIVGTPTSESPLDYQYEDTAGFAFDGSLDTHWRSNNQYAMGGAKARKVGQSNDRATLFLELEEESMNIELVPFNSMNVTQIAGISCVKIHQSAITTHQALHIGVVFWTGLSWQEYTTIDSMGGNGWQYRPAFKNTLWRILNQESTKKAWQVSELHFFADRICGHQTPGVPFGNEASRDTNTCVGFGTCEKDSVVRIMDDDLDTGYY